MNKQLEDKLRLLKVDLLSFLHALAVTDAVSLDYKELSTATSTAEPDELKGKIGTLRRMKFDDETLIVPAGRDNDGRLRWKINEKLVNKRDLALFIEGEIFGK